jgi:hypothetical protein
MKKEQERSGRKEMDNKREGERVEDKNLMHFESLMLSQPYC